MSWPASRRGWQGGRQLLLRRRLNWHHGAATWRWDHFRLVPHCMLQNGRQGTQRQKLSLRRSHLEVRSLLTDHTCMLQKWQRRCKLWQLRSHPLFCCEPSGPESCVIEKHLIDFDIWCEACI